MAVFNVFEHPERGLDGVELVREGFSSWAFVFTVLWALWHRMWVVAAILVILMAFMSIASIYGWLPATIASLMNFGLVLLFGYEAKGLRGLSLRWAGYREIAVVSAETLEVAELKHAFSRTTPAVPMTTTLAPPPILPPTDTLGLFGNV